jgi:maltose alpha-D-glucosyltransferase/alpha-amylase
MIKSTPVSRGNQRSRPPSDPRWYRDAVFYEVPVKAFYDGRGNGVGDFPGLTEKLPYLADLGITAIWLLPFFPSPWRDDGYDISDYNAVHPVYGSLRDFQTFLKQAHAHGLRVVTEMVLNHTSDQHVWFQRSRRAPPGSRWRNFYVWSDTPDRYRDARIIFKDFEHSNWTWDPVANAYFWHRFYSHQPDLNFDNPEVRKAVLDAVDFWLDMGVDGLRLDAVPYLFEREGTNCENLPETHQFLRQLRAHIDAKYQDRMLLAEANQWPEDAIAYFGSGDECHMAFHFPLMPRLFMSLRMEDRYPITDILRLTPPIPESCQWALFLRNHDELTLEMVTDEERDYMYRVYAHDPSARINLGIRRRLAPLLENDRRRTELMFALILSLPGTPVIYYGDEIGMGDNFYLGDRNGVRTPMQWSGDRNAGFSRANPQKLYLPVVIDPEYHYSAVNVENQQNNQHSLLRWMKRLIALRGRHKAFGRGTIRFLNPENRRVLAFVRETETERVLVVANLSRFSQPVELPLHPFRGLVPEEMFGRTRFPAIGEAPYFLSLGPHAFSWFLLCEPEPERETLQDEMRNFTAPAVSLRRLDDIFAAENLQKFEARLGDYLKTRRWFQGRSRTIAHTSILDVIGFPATSSYLLIVGLTYQDDNPETYCLPVSLGRGEEGEQVRMAHPDVILAEMEDEAGQRGVLYSATRNAAFCTELLGLMSRRRRVAGQKGELAGAHSREFRALLGPGRPALEPTLAAACQSNSSLLYGNRFILKLIRRIESGTHPEVEIGEAIAKLRDKPRVAPLAGWLEYRPETGAPAVAAILHGYVQNETDAWRYTLENLSLFFEHALSHASSLEAAQAAQVDALSGEDAPQIAHELTGSYLTAIRGLGVRTAEFHLSMSRVEQPEFAPEPFTDFYRMGLYHGLLATCARVFDLARERLPRLSGDLSEACEAAAVRQRECENRLHVLRERRISAQRIRIHGSYDLHSALYTGKDFVLIDFEGEPDRPLGERRIKRSPLRDVAGMMQSLAVAARTASGNLAAGQGPAEAARAPVAAWADLWRQWAAAEFFAGYVNTPGIASLLPQSREERRILMEIYALETAFYDLEHGFSRDPGKAAIAARTIVDVLDASR